MSAQVDPSVQLLYDYILARGTIIPIHDYSEELLRWGDVAKQVTESIRLGTPEWEELVPQAVKVQIKRLKLLGYREDALIQSSAKSNGARAGSDSSLAHGKVGQASTAA